MPSCTTEACGEDLFLSQLLSPSLSDPSQGRPLGHLSLMLGFEVSFTA